MLVHITYQGPFEPAMKVYMVPLGTGMSLSCTHFVKIFGHFVCASDKDFRRHIHKPPCITLV